MSSSTLTPSNRLVAPLDTRALSTAILTEIMLGEHAYAERSLDRDALEAVVFDNVASLLVALGGGALDIDPAQRAGRMKAEAGIPLAGVLHAYRIAGLRLWSELDRVASHEDPDGRQLFHLGSLIWTHLDQLSTAAAAAHRQVTDARERWDEQARIAALSHILDGDAAPGRLDDAARALHLTEPGRFVVIAIDRVGADTAPIVRGPARTFWLERGDHRVGLVASGEGATWDDASPRAGTRVGVSREFSMLHDAADALRHATVAMRSVPPGTGGTVRYGEAPIQSMVVTGPRAALDVADGVLAALEPLGSADRAQLLETFLAWFECDGSTAAAATRLHCHRNTVLYRLKKLQSLTGRDISRPADAAVVAIAVYAEQLLSTSPDDDRAATTVETVAGSLERESAAAPVPGR